MEQSHAVILKILGALLLVAAALQGHQLLAEPPGGPDVWITRSLPAVLVELELLLGIWLLSGLFRKAAWVAALACFVLFSFATFCKGLTGAASSGCLGAVQVNPWVVLVCIDLPAVAGLTAFRGLPHTVSAPSPSSVRVAMGVGAVLGLGVPAGVALVVYHPEKVSARELPVDVNAIRSRYVLLDPQSWVGKPFPLFEHIDIGDKLRHGRWLLLLHRHDCRECQNAVPCYRDMAEEIMRRNTRLVFVAVPPGGVDALEESPFYSVGRLSGAKRWVITTPAVAVLDRGMVVFSTEGKEPDRATLFELLSAMSRAGAGDDAAGICVSASRGSD